MARFAFHPRTPAAVKASCATRSAGDHGRLADLASTLARSRLPDRHGIAPSAVFMSSSRIRQRSPVSTIADPTTGIRSTTVNAALLTRTPSSVLINSTGIRLRVTRNQPRVCSRSDATSIARHSRSCSNPCSTAAARPTITASGSACMTARTRTLKLSASPQRAYIAGRTRTISPVLTAQLICPRNRGNSARLITPPAAASTFNKSLCTPKGLVRHSQNGHPDDALWISRRVGEITPDVPRAQRA